MRASTAAANFAFCSGILVLRLRLHGVVSSKLLVFHHTFTMSSSNLHKMLSSETERILNLSKYWQEVLDDTDNIPDEVAGRIRAHIGLSNLLVRDKFQQFAGLLTTYDAGVPDVGQKMTISDLEGFWDLIYIQVDDTIKKYHILQLLRQNDWQESYSSECMPSSPKKRLPLALLNNGGNSDRTGRTPSARRSPRVKKDHTEDARKRLAEAKLRLQRQGSAIGSSSGSRMVTSRSRTEDESLGAQHC